MATLETQDDIDRLEKAKDELKCIYPIIYKLAEGGMDEKRAACRAIHDQLKPSQLFPSAFMIDFKNGRTDGQALKRQLIDAVAEAENCELKESQKKAINAFVDKRIVATKGIRMEGPVSVSSMGSEAKVNGQKSKFTKGPPQYISRTVIGMSLAGQVKWDTEDGKAAEGTANFWDFSYRERKLIEASRLHSFRRRRNVPRDVKSLLPVMYWKAGSAKSWVEYKAGDSNMPKNGAPPTWASDYIDRIEGTKFLSEKMLLFPFEDITEPNKHQNAVYLLLCRFKGEGVPKESRVQAYVGKAKNGVEDRWMEHARVSTSLLQSYRWMDTFNADPLRGSLLVEVILARIYAQDGGICLTDNDNKNHDNLALFVYHAYGERRSGAEDKRMGKKEKKFIKKLEWRNLIGGTTGESCTFTFAVVSTPCGRFKVSTYD
uniref:Uncharacterized protein n=1 Tax=Branchiostoma floridae TaxID=7739 RepID=C3Y5Y9_BRAFL|eukprot:XP_002608376.1 hypothetical protein BRAFLDRAFT_91335 [Branchiostoma floridae]